MTPYLHNKLFSLEGKTALLTGGGRGIGLEIAKGFIETGASMGIFEKNITRSNIPVGIKTYSVDLIKHNNLEKYFNDFIQSCVLYLYFFLSFFREDR